MADPSRGLLLVTTDFGDASARALQLALEIGPLLGAEVVLVHVCAVPTYAYPSGRLVGLPRLRAAFVDAARQRLDAWAAQHPGVRTSLRVGLVVPELLRAIDELEPLLVVVGARPREGWRRAWAASVAEQLVRESSRPVLTVPVPPRRARAA